MSIELWLSGEKERLEKEIGILKKEKSRHKEGLLQLQKNQGSYKWFYKSERKGSKRSYIPKSNKELAKTLAENTYRTALIEDKEEELFRLKYLLEHPLHNKASRILTNPGFLELLDLPEADSEKWKREEYKKYSKYAEKKTIRAKNGTRVRSKSEAIIMDLLESRGIPYRYEPVISLNDQSFYPDFLIRHPRTGKLYIWEHLGKTDDADYLNSNMEKIRRYILAGYLPSVDLIITWESQEHPLDIRYVSFLISYYFE